MERILIDSDGSFRVKFSSCHFPQQRKIPKSKWIDRVEDMSHNVCHFAPFACQGRMTDTFDARCTARIYRQGSPPIKMQYLAIRYDSSFVRFSRMEILRLVHLNFRFPILGTTGATPFSHVVMVDYDDNFMKSKLYSNKLQLQSRRSHLQIDTIIVNSIHHPSCSLLLNPLPFWPTALPSVAGMYRILRKTSNKRSRSKKSKEKRRMPTRQHDSGEGESAID